MEQKTKEILHQRAETLSRPIEQEETETEKILIFFLGSEWYGLKLNCIKEVLKVEKITVLPNGPQAIRGLINLRGNILSITDPKPLLGLSSGEAAGLKTVVVIEDEDVQTGVLVDGVYEVVEASSKSIEPVLLTLEGGKGEYLIGEFLHKNKLVGLLNPKNLLSFEEEHKKPK